VVLRVCLGWTERRANRATRESRAGSASPVGTDSTVSVDLRETAVSPDPLVVTVSRVGVDLQDPRGHRERWWRARRCPVRPGPLAWTASPVYPACPDPRESWVLVEPRDNEENLACRESVDPQASRARRAGRAIVGFRDRTERRESRGSLERPDLREYRVRPVCLVSLGSREYLDCPGTQDHQGDRVTWDPRDLTARTGRMEGRVCPEPQETVASQERMEPPEFKDCQVLQDPRVTLDPPDFPDTRVRLANRETLVCPDPRDSADIVDHLDPRATWVCQDLWVPRDHKD